MFARKSFLITINQIICGLLGYIGFFYIVRYMGPEAVGIFGFATGFVGLFSFIADLGFSNAHIKRVSEGKDFGICIGTFLIIKIVLLVIKLGSVFCSIAVWKYILGRGFETPIHEIVVYIMLFESALYNFYTVVISTFTAKMEMAKDQVCLLFCGITRVPVIVSAVIFQLGIIPVATAYFLGTLSRAIVGLYFFRQYPINKFNIDYFKSYLKYTIPLFTFTITKSIAVNLDRVLIQLFFTSVDVGYYYAPQKILAFIFTLAVPINVLLLPTISKFHSNNEIEKIRMFIQNTERYLSMIIFLLCVTLVILAIPIIRIFLSADFFPGVWIFRTMVFALTIGWLSCPYSALILGFDKPTLFAKISVFDTILVICLNIILIPHNIFGLKLFGLGGLGAVISTLAVAIISYIIWRYAGYKYIKIKPSVSTIKIFCTALLTGILLYLLNNIFHIETLYQLLVLSLIGLGFYICILHVLNEFTKDDLNFFLDTLNIKKMLSYAKEELKIKTQNDKDR